MIKATKKDKKHVIQLLTGAFAANQSVNYLVKSGDRRKQGLEALMDYSFELCYHYGAVYLNEDRSACALLLYPEQKRWGLFTLYQDIKLICYGIGWSHLLKALQREALIQKVQPKGRGCYLWFIGVLPLYQGKGKGGILLQEILDLAAAQNRGVYLETSTLENLPWYQKHGFSIYHELDLGYTLYFLEWNLYK